MATGTHPTMWLEQVRGLARQDPKKTWMLLVLGVVLAVMVGRVVLKGDSQPNRAGAAMASTRAGAAPPAATTSSGRAELQIASPGAGANTGGFASADSSRTHNANQRLVEWMNEPVRPISRNLFAVRLEYFPVDGSRPALGIKTAADGEFWGRLEKSLTLQADQRDKRENLLANFKAEASRLRLDSIIMGPTPKAMIDGKLVAEGDVVAWAFRVLKIEPRRIIVEREGIRLEIQMK